MLRGAGCARRTESQQDDEKLFNALCPANKKGERKFSPTMLRRLKKLGIDKTDPNELTPEERSRCPPRHRPERHSMAARHRRQRPLPAEVQVGLGKDEAGFEHRSGYDITVASEIMAILALTTSLEDMRDRLGKMVVATSKKGEAVTAEDLGVAGADRADEGRHQAQPDANPRRDARLCPGPVANIAHGQSSIIADKIALKLADYVITESGFGADIGMEKFMDIKCRYSG